VSYWSVIGAVNAAIAIGLGAFAAHGLKGRVPPDMLLVFETGARYHMYHALGLLAVAWLSTERGPAANLPGILMLAGIVLFSGSLYALSLSGVRWLGAITPLGGLAFIAAWVSFAYLALPNRSP
jgi:uncharacterized membrane protein YgdD (TMEM256/DUF423 family)